MNSYYTYTDESFVDCYLELNANFYCERAVFTSTFFKVSNSMYYYKGEEYAILHDSLQDKLTAMITIDKTAFEMQWNKVYTGKDEITFLLKRAEFRREN